MTVETYEKANELYHEKLRIEVLLDRVKNRSTSAGLVEDSCDSLIDPEVHLQLSKVFKDVLSQHLNSKLEKTVLEFQELK